MGGGRKVGGCVVGRRKVGGCVVGGSSGGDGAFVCVGKVKGWGR